MRGCKVKPTSTQKIREIAKIVRGALGSPTGYIDIQTVLEFVFPTMLDDFEYEIIEKRILGNDHARTYPLHNKIQIREDVYEGLCNGNKRDRFTIAHEIGHLFLHRDESYYARNQTDKSEHKIYEDSEWQADTFAAEFLIPFTDDLSNKTVTEISDIYGVSLQAAKNKHSKIQQQNLS